MRIWCAWLPMAVQLRQGCVSGLVPLTGLGAMWPRGHWRKCSSFPPKFLLSPNHGKEACGFVNLMSPSGSRRSHDMGQRCFGSHKPRVYTFTNTETLLPTEETKSHKSVSHLPPYPFCSHYHCHCLWVDNRYKSHGLECCCYLLEYTMREWRRNMLTMEQRNHQ